MPRCFLIVLLGLIPCCLPSLPLAHQARISLTDPPIVKGYGPFDTFSEEALQDLVDRILSDTGKYLPELEVIHPDQGAVVPDDLATVHIAWRDRYLQSNCWLVSLTFADGKQFHRFTTESLFTPDQVLWQRISGGASDHTVTIEIRGLHYGSAIFPVTHSRRQVVISKHPFDGLIVFKRVPLPFSKNKQLPQRSQWLLGDLRRSAPPEVILENVSSCANCHRFSSDGKHFGMDIDRGRDKGGYLVGEVAPHMNLTEENYFSWNAYPEIGDTNMGLFTTFSPTGRYLATTVREKSLFVMFEDLMYSQLFFPITGKIAIYDRKKDRIQLLHGAARRDRVQTCPEFSPDGKRILFAVAEKRQELLSVMEGKDFLSPQPGETIFDLNSRYRLRFNIYTMPFNGGAGGEPRPLDGAANNGTSNYFPRFSPDGKWVVFCRSENGLVLQPDSRLYVVPSRGGEARSLACNTPRMNSWHSFSPNGHWLVFASKAISPFTEILLTHFDADGNAYPPVALNRFNRDGFAALIPEVIPLSADPIRKISVQLAERISTQPRGPD